MKNQLNDIQKELKHIRGTLTMLSESATRLENLIDGTDVGPSQKQALGDKHVAEILKRRKAVRNGQTK